MNIFSQPTPLVNLYTDDSHLNIVSKPTYSIQKSIYPNGPISSSTPLCPAERKRRLRRPIRRYKFNKSNFVYFGQDPITKFVECLGKPSCINKVVELFSIDLDLKDILTQNTDLVNCQDKKNVNKTRDPQAKDNKLIAENSTPKKKVEGKRLNTKISPLIHIKNTNSGFESSTMLPNMPSLCTPIKIDPRSEAADPAEGQDADLAKKNISIEISEIGISNFQSTSSQSLTNVHSESCNQEITVDSIPKDNQDEMNAVFVSSSTVKPATRKEPSGAEKKRAKLRKEFLANLAISTPEDRAVEKKKNEMFALAYYDKMRETLEMAAYHQIMQILNDYEEGDAVELYFKVEAVLRPKYNELADEFLLFLREREAAGVGRLVPWIRMNNRSKFLRKLEIYFKDQPSQLRKIYQCLTELSQAVGVSMEKIKTTLVPMFKGNAVLTDLFLQNFLDQPPPPSLLEGPYEVIDMNKELSMNDDEESFETITVPDIEDKYGGNTCICSCHEIEDVEFKSKFRHCSRCGTKFLNGRVFIQTGRGLRPATVSFLTSPNVDHHARLEDKSANTFIQRKKRSDSSPSKQVSHSTSKDNPDEETDEDGDKKKKPKRKPQRTKKQKSTEDTDAKVRKKKTTPARSRNLNKEFKSSPRKRTYSTKKSNVTPKPKQVEIKVEGHGETEVEKHVETEHEEQVETELEEQIDIELEDKNSTKPGSSDGQQKRLHEESCEEGDQSAAGESSGEVKLGSPEQQTAESESEFCEESSQDNCESDSNSSTSSTRNRTQTYADVLEQNSSWKREEDKIILEVFQTENDKDNAFRAIANQLKNRTVDEIKYRFDTLMDLLMKTVEDHRD